MRIETEVRINATAEKVWQVLTDFNGYPKWNPFITSLEGEVKVGKEIKVVLADMTFKPIVKSYEPFKKFSWLGKLWIKGLFDGHHQFEIIEESAGYVILKHSEDFKGVLVPLFKKKLNNGTKKGFMAMNKEVKMRAESFN